VIEGDFQAPNWLDLQRLHHNPRIEMFADDSCVVGVGFFERVRRDIESRYHMAVLAKAPNTPEANSAAGAGDDDFLR
jgi:hypothetical protein